jgi:hypothetical protein
MTMPGYRGKMNSKNAIFVGDGEVNEYSPQKSSSGTVGLSQLHIHVMLD